jgi:putative acetyltransferase
MNIRRVVSQDRGDILNVYMTAFPVEENELIAKLAMTLIANDLASNLFNWVAEIEGRVVAHIAFSPVVIESNPELQGYILAPLAVHPDYQKQGIGSALINKGVQALMDEGGHLVFVYGDPAYYGQFGFHAETAERFMPAYALQYAFGWQGMMLNEFVIQDESLSIQCVDALNDAALW